MPEEVQQPSAQPETPAESVEKTIVDTSAEITEPSDSVDLESDADGTSNEAQGEQEDSDTFESDRQELLAALRAQKNGTTPEAEQVKDQFAETRQFLEDQLGEEGVKAFDPIMTELATLRQEKAQREQAEAARKEIAIIDAALSEFNLTGYGDPNNRTNADLRRMEGLRNVAVAIRTQLAAFGKNVSDAQAIRLADYTLKGEVPEAEQVKKAVDQLGKRHAARTVVTGKGKVGTAPVHPAFAHLDKNDPQIKAKKKAIAMSIGIPVPE
jgi:hypothetical protein